MVNFCSVCGKSADNQRLCFNSGNQFVPDKQSPRLPDLQAPAPVSSRSADKTEILLDKLLFINKFVVIPLLIIVIVGIISLFVFGLIGSGAQVPEDPIEDIEEEIVEIEPIEQEIVIQVPDFVDRSFDELSQSSESVAFFDFTIEYVYDDEIPEGYIISQSIEPGEEIALAHFNESIPMYLVISSGIDPATEAPHDIEVMFGRISLPGRDEDNPGITIKVEEFIILTARINDPDLAEEGIVEWESSDESIFEITSANEADNTARITAVRAGRAYLTARVDEFEDVISVNVTN
jgi:hypothetical protein